MRIKAIALQSFGSIQTEEGEQWFLRKVVLTITTVISEHAVEDWHGFLPRPPPKRYPTLLILIYVH